MLKQPATGVYEGDAEFHVVTLYFKRAYRNLGRFKLKVTHGDNEVFADLY